MSRVRLYLMDVEGTVAPVSLVYEQMFPYARRHLGAYLRTHGSEAQVQADLELLEAENRAETEASPRLRSSHDRSSHDIEGAISYIEWLMDRDRKSTALKSLQGGVWRQGFESGELVGTVFEDVPEAFERWSRVARVGIYSSGSVEAQRLLFRYSSAGDLSGLIAGYFDTRTGAKNQAGSYRLIADRMEVAPDEVMFFSDVVRELDAAREAGCQTRLVVRPGNAAVVEGHGHGVVTTLADEADEAGEVAEAG